MAKSVNNQKNSKKSSLDGAKGGNNKMLHKQHTGPQKSGVSSQETGDGKSSFGVKGGSGHMFGKQTVKPVKPA